MLLVTITASIICICLAYFMYQSRPKGFPPGPIWYPILGNLLFVHRLHAKLGYFHLVWLELARQYGLLVGMKLGGNLVIVVNGFEAIKAVSTLQECDGKPDGFVFKMRTYEQRLGVGLTDGPLWMKTRNFVVKNLRLLGVGRVKMQTVILDEACVLVEEIKRSFKSELKKRRLEDFSNLIRLSILNSQWTLVSGKRFDLNDRHLTDLQKLVSSFFKSADFSGGIVNQIPWIRFVAPHWSGYSGMKALVKPLQKFSEELVEEHKMKIDLSLDEQGNLVDAYLAMIATADKNDAIFNGKQNKFL
ncbi:methyl farnesoate epoxidase [Neocloeon triangulifer]|uniref:methyl farnesoate epoxidase n=1 Tax=Neocloeon triangulifer TaxID=2078957 RepID=UPI00286EDE7B|nr:methyl farnesoate epoxidase [Neocloeon triangulifer]